MDGVLDAIENGNLTKMCACMENILEHVTQTEYPVIAMLKDKLKGNGALGALMSGSVPTVFGLFEDGKMAQKAINELKKTGEVSFGCVTTFSDRTCVISQ